MDSSVSQPSHSQDDPDEPLTPQRSPSRLEFRMEDLEVDHGSPMHSLDLFCASAREGFSYTFVDEEDPFASDIPAHLRLLIEEPMVEPQPTDLPAHEKTGPPPTLFLPNDPEENMGPLAPIPVRLPSVQIPVDVQESIMPSSTTPKRLNYPHRGFSHSALLQQKSLWYSRHEEWAEWQSRMGQGEAQNQEPNTHDAYTGIATHQRAVSPPPRMRTPPSGLERDQPPTGHARGTQGIHSSIFPRVGDISALRDPYPVNIDRSFFMFPLWTLNKALYMFDMQQRSAPFVTPALVQASTSTSTLSSYSSSTSEDDEESDSTLVADDSPVPKSQPPFEPLRALSPRSPLRSWDDFCAWGLSWYAKWHVLLGIFQRDHTRYDAFGFPIKAPPPPPDRIFHFTVGEDDDNDGTDEEIDYEKVLADSTFNADFDEECQRALAFYNRELRRSGVTW